MLVDHRKVLACIETMVQGIGPRITSLEEITHERFVEAKNVRLRASAIDHGTHPYFGDLVTASLDDPCSEPGCVRVKIFQATCNHAEITVRD